MNDRTALFSLVTLGLILCCGSTRALDLLRPEPTSFHCRGFGYVAEIFPPKSRQNPGDKPVCYLYQMGHPGGTWKIDARLKWKAELINDQTTYYRMPLEVLLSMDGRLVTLNDYSRIGYKNAVVIYGSDGKLVKSWHLDKLIPKDELKQIELNMRGRWWNREARYFFLREPARLYILLKTGRAMEFSLKDGAFKYGAPAHFHGLAAVTKKRHPDKEAKVWATSLRFSSITDVLAAAPEAVLHPEPTKPQKPRVREKDSATRIYLRANALRRKRKLDEAAALYRKVVKEYPGTSPAYQSSLFLSRIQASQGEPEEAFKTLLAARLSDLKRAGTPPRTKAELEILHARVRVKVARACANAETIDGLELARAQYQKLIDDHPNSPLVPRAKKRIEELDRQIPLERSRQKERKVLVALVKRIEKALNEKDVEAWLALHAPSTNLEKKRQEFEEGIKNPEVLAMLPIAYEVDRVQFSDDMKYAEVSAGVRIAGAKERSKRHGETFYFVKTAAGWRLGRPKYRTN